MDRIFYAHDALLTGSDIASALLEYAHALAKRDASATVSIPFRREDGSIGRAKLLIGPASQLVSESAVEDDDELVDTELVASFRREIDALGISRAEALDPKDVSHAEDAWGAASESS